MSAAPPEERAGLRGAAALTGMAFLAGALGAALETGFFTVLLAAFFLAGIDKAPGPDTKGAALYRIADGGASLTGSRPAGRGGAGSLGQLDERRGLPAWLELFRHH